MSDNLIDTWKITEMELWGEDFINAEVEGYISFLETETGEFQFGYVHGYLQFNSAGLTENLIEFTWEGNDEMDMAHGRGKACLRNNELIGEICFHNGDTSSFQAVRREAK
ncbi:MAG: hypothetical protein HAW66_07290 [Shewanella sp.]|nr:hypothetical protein [Shewanella sp.]